MISFLTRKWMLYGVAAVMTSSAAVAQAQGYPDRAVTIVVPTTAGGTADILGRLLGKKLGDMWGQPVVVENRSGAGTQIGTEYAARAKPDGYTLMLTFNELATLSAVNKNTRVDVVRDFTRVGKIGSLPVVILGNPKMTANTMGELVKQLQAAPGKYTYSSGGPGSILHLYTEMFKQVAKVDMLHVPYRGALEASTALIAGEVDVLVQFANGNVINYVTSGKAKGYAVASPQRLTRLPDVPTTAEVGMPDLQLEAWYGLFAPAGLPNDLKQKINRDLIEVMKQPDIQERLATLNMQVQSGTSESFDAFFLNEHERWTKLIADAGIQGN